MNTKTLLLLLCLPLLLATSTACNKRSAQQPPPVEAQAPTPVEAQAPTPVEAQAPTPVEAHAPAAGDTTRSLSYGGQERTYILHIPAACNPAQPVPLVLAFHGIGLNAQEMIRISGFSAQADQVGFLVAYPNGTGKKPSWNGGMCCGEAAVKKVDDVGFVRFLIEELSKELNIDRKRVYATGFSNGAIFAYRLACDLSDQLAAIGPVAAAPAVQDLQACQPQRAVPVIHFHGTDDRLNPYEGAVTQAGTQFASVEDTIQKWIQLDGCPSQPQTTRSGSIVQDVYSPCAAAAALELFTIQGGEHAWPGGQAVSPQVGEPNMEISATQLMWEFFAAHALP